MIPDFDKFGHLPVGGHSCSLDEFFARFRFNDHRLRLCTKFEGILALARRCGFLAVLIGGSFPTAKEEPRDMDLTWITDPNVDKDKVKPECRALMDDAAAAGAYGWSMLYLPINHDAQEINYWARELGFCYHTNRSRGMIFIDL
jgi:hypothetical protein